MLKFRALQIAGGLLICSAVLLAADNRALGTWRLKSEKVIAGGSAAPHLAANTIMVVRQGSSGNLILELKPRPPEVLLQQRVEFGADFSRDGKTMTEDIIGTEPKPYRMTRIWDKR